MRPSLSIPGLSILILGGLLAVACRAQEPAESSSKQTSAESTAQQGSEQGQGNGNGAQNAQDAPSSPQAAPDAQGAGQSTATDQKDAAQPDKPGTMQRLKKHLRDQVSTGCVNAIGQHCWDKPPKDDSKKDASQQQGNDAAAAQLPPNAPPPRSDDQDESGQSSGESSSKGTKIDLSPPPGEAPAFGVGGDSDVREMKPWDPHKADKDVEIGDFYFKQKNYRAAESRYTEALYWQDNHAIAMFRLAKTEEKLGKFDDAQKNYAGYLKILPDGEFSAQAKQGLERAKAKSGQSAKAEVSKK